MQFFVLTAVLYALTALPQRLAASLLTPSLDLTAGTRANSEGVCPSGPSANPQCCSTDILGVAALDCASPFFSPRNVADFRKICAAQGNQAKCCVLVLVGQGVLWTNP
ncbi:fungal hydrophobin-domain-containing protein [Mycena capillaripes]|nr:fungal hydrophobin-domain-containing protein [Mycena capillaripes]